MTVLGGVRFLMSEVPLYVLLRMLEVSGDASLVGRVVTTKIQDSLSSVCQIAAGPQGYLFRSPGRAPLQDYLAYPLSDQ